MASPVGLLEVVVLLEAQLVASKDAQKGSPSLEFAQVADEAVMSRFSITEGTDEPDPLSCNR